MAPTSQAQPLPDPGYTPGFGRKSAAALVLAVSSGAFVGLALNIAISLLSLPIREELSWLAGGLGAMLVVALLDNRDQGSEVLTLPTHPASEVGLTSRPVLRTPPRVSVVIPALDEAENLRHLLKRLPKGLHEVILVDGNSTDGTVEVARRELPSIRVVAQPGRGKGDALRAGFEAVTGEAIVMLDADGSANPAEIPRFIDALRNGADFAKGSRFTEDGGSADITMLRRFGNGMLVNVSNFLCGTGYSDLCYGYNAFWTDCLPYISPDVGGFEVETMMNIRAARSGLAVQEVPSFELPRIHGKSHLRPWRDGLRVLRTILRECRRGARRSDRPELGVSTIAAKPESQHSN
jgi:hypothetical protein